MRIRTFLKPLSFLPAILLMYMIFTFSAQNGEVSATVSYKASCMIVKAADTVFDMGLDDYQVSYFATKIHGVTRKLAHMTEYFLLAIAVSFPLYVYGLHGILLMLLAGGFCIAFACGDEYHQSFVAGRSPSSRDVLIDSIGVFIGIIVVRIIGWTGRMTIFRSPAKKEPEMKMSRKEKKQWKKQQKAMKNGYAPEADMPYQNGPYPNGPYPGGPYPNQPYTNGPAQGGNYAGGPYSNRPYPPNYNEPNGNFNGPYADGPYQGDYGPYPEEPYQGNYRPYDGNPYQGYGPNPGDSYQGGYGPSDPYQGNYGGPYPENPYQGDPQFYGQPQAPQYMGKQDHSSDELADDMPLSHLLKPKK